MTKTDVAGTRPFTRTDIPVSVNTIDSKVEHCTVRVTPIKGLPLIVCSVYRLPSCKLPDWQSEFHELFDRLTSDKLPIVVIGDLKVNLLSNGTFSDNLKSNFHLIQTITEPTRITNKVATLIDHVYVSGRSMGAESGVINPHLSDHCAVYCTLTQQC